MASATHVVQDLYSAVGFSAQLQALKSVKGVLTGHLSRKLEYIQNGLVPHVAEILAEVAAQRDEDAAEATALDHLQESLLTQVAQILAVLSHEGPSFVYPILETDVLQRLVAFLLLPLSPKTFLAVLRCLNAVADNLPPESPGRWSQDGQLAELLYSRKYIQCFEHVIRSGSAVVASQQACDAILALLCKTVTHETQKRALVDCGLLSLLSARLASFVVAEGLVPPSSEVSREGAGPAALPDAAPTTAHLSPLLEALCVLTDGSRSRMKIFLTNPLIRSVLPEFKDDFLPTDIRRAPWGASYFSGAAVPRARLQSPFDPLLPSAPVSEKAYATQPGFPPLGSVTTLPRRRASFLPNTGGVPILPLNQTTENVQESGVVSWLLYVARESRGKRRLLATKLLVSLNSLNFVKKDRGSSFASLLVPLLTRMLELDPTQCSTSQLSGSYLCTGIHYTRAVPAVLAALVMDNSHMQGVAVDGKAITKLSLGLKTTFDGPAGSRTTPWQPHKRDRMETDSTPAATRLGPNGPSCTVRKDMDYREGCLKALAAIAPFEEDYRAQICNEGVLPHIIQSLEPYQTQTSANGYLELTGNSTSVMVAACAAVRALARSVQALRTKLIEAEIAKPILALMNSKNPELRIAATKVLTNLAMDFSAVKESVGESAVVKKLCEQAHSANARLRHESLWALKQVVLNASKKLKLEVVDELGCSWIKLLIKTDPIDIPEGEIIGLVERDYPPITTWRRPAATSDVPPDIAMGEDSESDEGSDEVTNTNVFVEGAASDESGFDTKHTVEDDTDIQAQLLDLLRNLFCGDHASEMVRYILDEMGQEDFFRIMLDRLRPRTLAGPTRKDNYVTPAPILIVGKVLFVLVHIAASDPRWRNIMSSQHALLKQVLTFCNHADREIRSTCCWIALNLTYDNDASERAGCRQRAIELQKIGFISHLRKMENDSDLDVRERAKAALHMMTSLN